jgi:hypothetical protein
MRLTLTQQRPGNTCQMTPGMFINSGAARTSSADFGGKCWNGPAATGGDAPISPVSPLLFLAPRGFPHHRQDAGLDRLGQGGPSGNDGANIPPPPPGVSLAHQPPDSPRDWLAPTPRSPQGLGAFRPPTSPTGRLTQVPRAPLGLGRCAGPFSPPS